MVNATIAECDGCGWSKVIVFVDDYGKGFCKNCCKSEEKDLFDGDRDTYGT